MKFLVDMGLSPVIVSFLENQGHDAVRVNIRELPISREGWNSEPNSVDSL